MSVAATRVLIRGAFVGAGLPPDTYDTGMHIEFDKNFNLSHSFDPPFGSNQIEGYPYSLFYRTSVAAPGDDTVLLVGTNYESVGQGRVYISRGNGTETLWDFTPELVVEQAIGAPPGTVAEGLAMINGGGWTCLCEIRQADNNAAIPNVVATRPDETGFAVIRSITLPPSDYGAIAGLAVFGDEFFYFEVDTEDGTAKSLVKIDLNTEVSSTVIDEATLGGKNTRSAFLAHDNTGAAKYLVCPVDGYVDLVSPATWVPHTLVSFAGFDKGAGQMGSSLVFLAGEVLYGVSNAYDSPSAWTVVNLTNGSGSDPLYGYNMGAPSATTFEFGGDPPQPPVTCFWTDRLRVEEDC